MDSEVDALFLELQAQVAGRYSVEREIGRGGTGVVYLAREVRLDRLVAIKVLLPEQAALPPARHRFLQEARTAARLSHPHIVPVLTVEEHGALVFFTMPYIAGGTLAERVAASGPLAPPEAVRMLREIAWALAYSHGLGIVHRDIKPGNILLESSGRRALVTDFGIAAAAGSVSSLEGVVVGTPAFMSPEQVRGGGADARSDLYALGLVGYYALAGTMPFDAPTRETQLRAHLEAQPRALSAVAAEVPDSLAGPIMLCLQKDPAERPQSAEEFGTGLAGWLDEQRPVPTAVRLFIGQLTDSKPIALVYTTFASLLLLVQLILAFNDLWQLLAVTILAGLFALPPTLVLCARVRKLLASGNTRDDLVAALQDDMRVARFRTSPQTRAGLAWKRPLFRWSVILALVSAFPWILPGGPSRRDLVFIANLITVACAVVVGDQVLSVERGRGRVRFWEGAIGRTLFRVAGLGVRRTSRGAVNVDQRTEVAICFSALALFDRLPKETRNGLGDVRSTLERLERDAGALRLRQREVKRLLLDSADDVVGARLSTTEQSLGRKYADVITALEGIRLGLLRLHAGVASPEGLTTDLGIAADLGTRLGQLSRAQQEVDELLV